MSPLTKQGRHLKGIFLEEYGKKRGTRIFYAFENKHRNNPSPNFMIHSPLLLKGRKSY